MSGSVIPVGISRRYLLFNDMGGRLLLGEFHQDLGEPLG